jgi:transposase
VLLDPVEQQLDGAARGRLYRDDGRRGTARWLGGRAVIERDLNGTAADSKLIAVYRQPRIGALPVGVEDACAGREGIESHLERAGADLGGRGSAHRPMQLHRERAAADVDRDDPTGIGQHPVDSGRAAIELDRADIEARQEEPGVPADKIDARVLAELTRRALVPEIWLPTPEVRAERERARFRLHLVRHRSALKNRIHAILIAFGRACPMSDLFGVAGRELLDSLALPEPWQTNLVESLALVDDLTARIDALELELRRLGAEHPSMRLLMTVPGVGWVLAYTIASEIGDIDRFASPKKLAGYTGLCPLVRQSGGKDRRGPLAKNGPTYLRWALIEAATHAARDPRYRERYERTKQRLGRQRGAKIARVDLARQLAEAIWHVLTKNEPFHPAGPAMGLVA